MNLMTSRPGIRPEWGEQRLRYSILRAVYDRTEGRVDRPVTGSEIGAMLNLRYEDLYRVVHFLEYNGYLAYLGSGPRVSITDQGVRYIEDLADRRRTIREPEWQFAYRGSRGTSREPTRQDTDSDASPTAGGGTGVTGTAAATSPAKRATSTPDMN